MRPVFALMSLLCFSALAWAGDWPAWRGPSGQGYCDEKNLPTKWSKTENIKWKVPLERPGNSTPVVWGERIFMTQANKGGTQRSLLCFSRADGKLLWRKDIEYPDKERNWTPDWYGNASPAVDGERVVISLGSAGMFCYDLEGKELWKRDLGKFEHSFGNGSSPVFYGDTVILWAGVNEAGKGRNDLIAVDKKTGTTVWETKEKGGSWSTPLIVKVDGKDQLILGVPKKLKGFDPATGKELWFCDGLTDLVYTSALYGNGIAVAMSGYGGSAMAVKLGGTGDITRNRLWLHPKNTQRVGSGVIVGEHVYILEESCVPHCYELATGNEVWQTGRVSGGGTWSSMLLTEGRIYVLTKQGDTHLFAASPTFELLGTNKLGDSTNASIAVSNGELFIRTDRALWCIREAK